MRIEARFKDIIDQPSPLQEMMDDLVKRAVAASMRGETVVLILDGEVVDIISPPLWR